MDSFFTARKTCIKSTPFWLGFSSGEKLFLRQEANEQHGELTVCFAPSFVRQRVAGCASSAGRVQTAVLGVLHVRTVTHTKGKRYAVFCGMTTRPAHYPKKTMVSNQLSKKDPDVFM